MPQGEDALDSLKSTVDTSMDWGTSKIRQADKALAAKGVTPVGGAALATGVIGAGMLLRHILRTKDQPRYVR